MPGAPPASCALTRPSAAPPQLFLLLLSLPSTVRRDLQHCDVGCKLLHKPPNDLDVVLKVPQLLQRLRNLPYSCRHAGKVALQGGELYTYGGRFLLDLKLGVVDLRKDRAVAWPLAVAVVVWPLAAARAPTRRMVWGGAPEQRRSS